MIATIVYICFTKLLFRNNLSQIDIVLTGRENYNLGPLSTLTSQVLMLAIPS